MDWKKSTMYVLPASGSFRHSLSYCTDASQKRAVISIHTEVTTSREAQFLRVPNRPEFLYASPQILIRIYRYYFVLEEDRVLLPFTITVTPCDVPIEWSILVHKASASLLGKAAQGKIFSLLEKSCRKYKLQLRSVVTQSSLHLKYHTCSSCKRASEDTVTDEICSSLDFAMKARRLKITSMQVKNSKISGEHRHELLHKLLALTQFSPLQTYLP